MIIGSQLKAQYYFYNGEYYEADFVYEIGGSLGAMNALTDPSKDAYIYYLSVSNWD